MTVQSLLDQIDALVEAFREQHHVPAVMLGFMGPDELREVLRPYGALEPENKSKPSSSTIFELGSVTKTFTGTALAWVSQQQGMRPDAPVQKYVPNFDNGGVTLPIWENEIEINFVDLADFAPGFPDDTTHTIPGQHTYKQLFEWISDHPDLLVTQPGTVYSYANSAFELLGSVLAYVNHQEFNYSLLLQALLDAGKFSMPDTVVNLSPAQKKRLAPSYIDKQRAPYVTGDWRIKSTMQDMMVWLNYNMGLLSSPFNELLPVTLQERFKRQTGGTGLGWFITPLTSDITRYSKNGATNGFSNYIAFVQGKGLERSMGVVILTNVQPANTSLLGNQILNLLAGLSHQDDDSQNDDIDAGG